MRYFFRYILFLALVFNFAVSAQGKDKIEIDSAYNFEMLRQVPATPVKSQDRTGTCWAFATTSFLESELLRLGKGGYDLSEMFVVRNVYPLKGEKYIRYHGNLTFGEGGQAHDVLNILRTKGCMPESAYSGKIIDSLKYNNGEMQAVLKAILDAILQRRGGKLSPVWKKVVESSLDIYLGKPPAEFVYKGETYTPEKFKTMLGLNPDDYVELTSYLDAPFYSKFNLELPDNWSFDLYYNIPVDDLIATMDYALENGFSVVWDGDVSDKYFDMKKGYAIVPDETKKNNDGKSESSNEKKEPIPEKQITQEMRQTAFNSFSATDDHLMHTVGLAKNHNGNKFYYTKNSWGKKGEYDGFIYMSEPYVRLNTIAITVHKNAVPPEIRSKLGF